jgi:hypothetical protein
MKRLLTVLVALLLPAVAAADDLSKYMEMMRSDLRNEKTKILTEGLHLSDVEDRKFWPIQREYENELAKVGDQRLQLIKDYSANYQKLTPEMAKKLVDRAFKVEDDRLKVLKKYTDKVAKEVSPMVAARFAQIEALVNSLVDLQLRADTPLVP